MKIVKKPIVLSLLMVILLLVVIALLRLTNRPEPNRAVPKKDTTVQPVTVPSPSGSAIVKHPSALPNQRTAVQKTINCLNAICENGASDQAIAQTHALMSQLDVTSEPFASGLAVLLKRVLAYREDSSDTLIKSSAASLSRFSGIPIELIDRAAAACDVKGRRKPDEIVLSFAGDCTFGMVNGDDSEIRFPSIYQRSSRVDYPFALMRPYFLNDDLTIVNFECTLTNAEKTADKEWHFKGAARYARIFPAASVNVAGISNNHSFDYLQMGFNDTVSNFTKANVPVFYQNTPYVTTTHGVETVIIGDCTVVGENTTRTDGVPERVINQIKRYRKPGNIVIVVMHWGSELDIVPRIWQQKLGRQFIDAGADAVVGHHPHVVQGIELYHDKYIAYSLGNFAFGGNSLAHFPETFVLRLRFHAENGKARRMEASIVPCWVTSSHRRNESGILHNNYQPEPVFGETADKTVNLVLERSAKLPNGVKAIQYLKVR